MKYFAESWDKFSKTKRMNEKLSGAKTSYDKLIVAATYGNIELAKELIEQGTPINPNPQDFVDVPLYCAAQTGELAMVKFLIENGANIEQESRLRANNTSLKVAIQSQRLDIIAYLIEKGANVNHRTSIYHETALDDLLFFAVFYDLKFTQTVLELLIDAGVNLYVNNMTPQKIFTRIKNEINSFAGNTEEKVLHLATIKNLLLPPQNENNLNNELLENEKSTRLVPILMSYSPIYKRAQVMQPEKTQPGLTEEDFILVEKDESESKPNNRRCFVM